MGLDELKKDILETAKKEVARIQEQTNQQLKAIEQESVKTLSKRKGVLEHEFEIEAKRLEQKETELIKSNAVNQSLVRKRELIDLAVDEAKALLEENAKTHVKKLLERAQKELPVARVYCRKADREYIKGFDVSTKEIDGGIVVENQDGTISIDYTYNTTLLHLKEKHLQEIVKVLFE